MASLCFRFAGEFLVLQKALAEAPRAAGLLPAMAAAAAASQAALPRAPPLGRAPGWRAALRAAAPLVALRRDATLAQALAAMREHRIHRVFIRSGGVEQGHENALPDAVVSITDILRALADGPPAGADEGFTPEMAAALEGRVNEFTDNLLSRLPPPGFWESEEGKAMMRDYC